MEKQILPITASMLYDLVACPHRVSMDLFGNPANRDPISPFVQLLWERGNAYEARVIASLSAPFVDLSYYTTDEKERRTLEAMDQKALLIYNGRIRAGELLGEPDILRLEACGYVPGDIKSGSGEEGPEDDSKPKPHYAVQLGLYVDILERQGRLSERRGFVWDIHGEEVLYDFTVVFGKKDPRTLWQDYQECLSEARAIAQKGKMTRPALVSACKQCHWRSSCFASLKKSDDLTLLPYLGRSKRDIMIESVPTVHEFARADVAKFIKGGKTIFSGIGPDMLAKFQARAQLHATAGSVPFAREPLVLPKHEVEIFYDVETDPMLDVCYLHGFVLRRGGDNAKEEYVHFFVVDPSHEAEKKIFRDAWEFIKKAVPCALYYYSPYERTTIRKLQKKYPEVCTEADVETLFAAETTVDLYNDVVRSKTEWPTHDFSIKTLAKALGFTWRDADPSGAASIEWFNKWLKTGDPTHQRRIIEYNEDDCRAMRVLLDGLRTLPVHG